MTKQPHRLEDIDIGILTAEASREYERVPKISFNSDNENLLRLSRSIAASNLVIVELLTRILEKEQHECACKVSDTDGFGHERPAS